MKQVFLNIRYSKLRNGEAVGFYRDIATAANNSDATKLQIKTDVTALEKSNQLVDDAFNGNFSSKFTEELLALEARRDDDLRGIRWTAKAAQLSRDAAKQKAGDTVLKCIDKYGKNIENQPVRVETTIIRNICADAAKAGADKDAFTLLGIDTWCADMNTTNNDFETKFELRGSDIISNKSKISTSEAVLNAKASYDSLLKNIEARNTLDNTGKYTNLIAEINQIIKDTNTKVKAKTTAVKTAKAKKIVK